MGILNKIKGKTAKAVEKTQTVPAVVAPKRNMVKSDFAAHILLRPLVSEKSTHAEAQKKYTFFVSSTATKVDVKRAVKEVYGILPQKVNMVVGEGKIKQSGRVSGKRNNLKKAIVTVAKDKNLEVHEGV